MSCYKPESKNSWTNSSIDPAVAEPDHTDNQRGCQGRYRKGFEKAKRYEILVQLILMMVPHACIRLHNQRKESEEEAGICPIKIQPS
jgi:hypothetical protein